MQRSLFCPTTRKVCERTLSRHHSRHFASACVNQHDSFFPNRFCSSSRFVTWLNKESKNAYEFHQTLPGYESTPFIELPELAQKLNVGQIHVKDEGKRWDLKAFKCLGTSYAVHKLPKNKDTVLTSMTAGNHGRGLAWVAQTFNLKCVIFVPHNVSQSRIDAMEKLGAQVIKLEGSYDEAIGTVKEEAEKNGWNLITDSSWPGYTEVCSDIIAGYCTIFSELDPDYNPTHVFVCGGVGGFAAAGAWYTFKKQFTSNYAPKLICIEPTRADCLFLSAQQEKMITTKQDCNSIMQGLNCGTPSLVSWDLLHNNVDCFKRVGDNFALQAVREYKNASVTSGESGAAGLAGLLSLTEEERIKLEINENSRILLVNTEADTDPELYQKIINHEYEHK